ncbi:MAG: DNA-binding protein, partial [Prevotella sp.]|nr:DNA-binding protein [Prevotella sp.]
MKKVFLSMLAIAIAAFTFTSCDDVPMPYDMPSSGGNGGNNYGTPSGEGTAADPFNVAAALSYIAAGEDLDQEVYVKGIIVSIDEVNTSFGNATFNISDDGTNTNVLKVYRSKGLNNQNIKSEDEISVGNEVVIVGKLVNYNGTYEFTQGCYIYSLNGSGGGGTGEATGDGTLANPYNSVAAANYAKSLGSDVNSPKDVYIKGKVVSIAVDKNGVAQNFDNGTYGNASFYISDDGT